MTTPPPLGTKYLLAVIDPDNQIVESDKTNNVASVASPAAVVNVITHGFNPTGTNWDQFRSPYYALACEFDTKFETQPTPDGTVKSYVSNWDSTSGWKGAAVSVAASLFLEFPFNVIALKYAQLSMQQAASNALQAAESIAAYITNPQNGYLVSPAYGQVIDLIGHSRVAAVNALVSQLLNTKGYTVNQYTSLDGYSTDWPFPSNILGDIPIVSDATASRKINYEVQQGLGQVLASWLSLLGIALPQADIVALLLDTTSWRAPDRPGFDNITILGTGKGSDPLSNHLNIVPLYSDLSSPYIYDNYEGKNLNNHSSAMSVAMSTADVPQASANAAATTVNYSNFTDGSFKTLGTFWNQLKAANISDGGDPLLSYWLAMVNDPTQLLASTWAVTGSAKRTQNSGNFGAEFDQTTGGTSIGQYLELDSQASSIGFDMSVLSAKPGDQLQVLLHNNVLGTFDLSSPSSSGHQTVSLAGYASQMGDVTFQLAGPAGDTAKVQLDNLTVNEANAPLTVDPIRAQSALSGTTFVAPITARDSAPGRTITYSLDPGSPSSATIDPNSGVLTWNVPISETPGDYPLTVRVTDDGSPSLSVTTSFTVTVGIIQQSTNLAAVSGTGAYDGTATLTATLGSGLTSGGLPLSGKVVAFTLNNGGTVTNIGTATTDQNGVATLAGVSLAGFNVGTSSGAITANFAGDAADLGSTASGDLAVNPDATSTTVVASADPSFLGQSLTFTATVSNTSASITPAGSVQFTIDGIPFGSPATLSGKTASVVDSALSLGSHTVTAVYVPAIGNFLISSDRLTPTVRLNLGLLLLDPTGKDALSETGSGNVVAQDVVNGVDLGAAIVVDSNNAEAAALTGSASVTAKYIGIVGGARTTGKGTFSSPINRNLAPIPDPVGLPLPPAPSPTYSAKNYSGSGALMLQPGTYVGGIKITGSGSVTLAPGVYYLQGGGFAMTGSASVTGNGVLIVNAPGHQGGTIRLTGSGSLTLSAPANLTGAYAPYAGLALFQDPASNAGISLTGNGSLSLTGTLYAPRAKLSLTGAGSVIATVGNNPANPVGAVIVADLSLTGSGSVTIGAGPPAPPVANRSSAGATSAATSGAVSAAIGLPVSQTIAPSLSTQNDLEVMNDVAASLVLVDGNDPAPNAKKPKKGTL